MTKFRLEGDLQANLAKMPDQQRRAVYASAQWVAPQAEAYMKGNAPWTDRTGNARSGLRARVRKNGENTVAIVLYHSVPYGVFLEVRWGGKYGVIPAAMAMAGPLWVEALGRLLFDQKVGS
jgi:hypothetical protein